MSTRMRRDGVLLGLREPEAPRGLRVSVVREAMGEAEQLETVLARVRRRSTSDCCTPYDVSGCVDSHVCAGFLVLTVIATVVHWEATAV